jgi:endonuclease G
MNHLLPRAATLGALLLPSSTRVIAVNTPNNNSLSSAWGGYRTTVDAIEAAGLDLLSALPMSVQNVVKAKTDAGPTN